MTPFKFCHSYTIHLFEFVLDLKQPKSVNLGIDIGPHGWGQAVLRKALAAKYFGAC